MDVMRIVCSKQKQYIAVSEKYTEVLNEFSTALRTEVVKSDAWIRALFNSQEEIKGMQPSFLTLSTKKLIDAFC